MSVEVLAFEMQLPDPEEDKVVPNAYCVLVEVHMNFETKTLVGVYKCWRSKQAWQSKYKPFETFNCTLESDKGGKMYFEQYGVDGAQTQLVKNLHQFYVQQNVLGAIKLPEEG